MCADKTQTDARQRRLEEQLRANLARRKQQSRARRQGDDDTRPSGIKSAEKPDETQDQ